MPTDRDTRVQSAGLVGSLPHGATTWLDYLRRNDSYFVYLAAGLLYVGLGLTLYASVLLWTDD